MLVILGIVIFFLLLLASGIRILKEYERGVLFRLGNCLLKLRGPGLTYVIPIIDKMIKVDLRTFTYDVPEQDVITRDNVSIKVNAVVYFQVVDARRSVLEVEKYMYATSQLAQTTLRSVCGQQELDHLLIERDKVNARIQAILDQNTDNWGVKVTLVEVKQIDLPQEMKRAMARQAVAERERRSKIINSLGEFESAQKLSEAAHIMAQNPITIQLRYLSTLAEIAAENNTTTIFPFPMEFMSFFEQHNKVDK
jgi:regulator of protease activity HflC (stomatin/prohibitin superfamily)